MAVKNNISSPRIIDELIRLLPYKKEALKVSDIARSWNVSGAMIRRLIEEGSLEAVPIPGQLKGTTTYLTTRTCVKNFLEKTWKENKALDFTRALVDFLEEGS